MGVLHGAFQSELEDETVAVREKLGPRLLLTSRRLPIIELVDADTRVLTSHVRDDRGTWSRVAPVRYRRIHH